MNPEIFTIGHSTRTVEAFISLLRMNAVTALCDVRSSPYSSFNPQFNKGELKAGLRSNGIQYVFLGKELGARSDDPSCYVDGQVQFERLAKTTLFRSGIERLRQGVQNFRIALMCAEKEPLDCHRTILVTRELVRAGFDVSHILDDGSIEKHSDTMQRLINRFGQGSDDLFMDQSEIEARAYDRQAEKVAYVKPKQEPIRKAAG